MDDRALTIVRRRHSRLSEYFFFFHPYYRILIIEYDAIYDSERRPKGVLLLIVGCTRVVRNNILVFIGIRRGNAAETATKLSRNFTPTASGRPAASKRARGRCVPHFDENFSLHFSNVCFFRDIKYAFRCFNDSTTGFLQQLPAI